MGHGHQDALYAEPLTYTSNFTTAHLGAAFRFIPMICTLNGENCSKSLKEDLFFFQNAYVVNSLHVLDLIRGTAMR